MILINITTQPTINQHRAAKQILAVNDVRLIISKYIIKYRGSMQQYPSSHGLSIQSQISCQYQTQQDTAYSQLVSALKQYQLILAITIKTSDICIDNTARLQEVLAEKLPATNRPDSRRYAYRLPLSAHDKTSGSLFWHAPNPNPNKETLKPIKPTQLITHSPTSITEEVAIKPIDTPVVKPKARSNHVTQPTGSPLRIQSLSSGTTTKQSRPPVADIKPDCRRQKPGNTKPHSRMGNPHYILEILGTGCRLDTQHKPQHSLSSRV